MRRCQYCGEVWVKVSGCDGETTCGLIPEEGDPYGSESFLQHLWEKVEGKMRPRKVTKATRITTRAAKTAVPNDVKVGCGRTIDWKNQAILSLSEVEALLSTQELEQVLISFGWDTNFTTKRKKKEAEIVVFSKIGVDGKVIDP